MSSKLEQELDNFLFFDGPMPNLSQGVKEVPYPLGFVYCRTHKKIDCDLDDPDPWKDYTDGGPDENPSQED